jgi:hypothetical protein
VGDGVAVAHVGVHCALADAAAWRKDIIAFPVRASLSFLRVGNGEVAVAHATYRFSFDALFFGLMLRSPRSGRLEA